MSATPTNPYAAAHLSPQGEGDARPTALQIIHDQNLVNKMQGKAILVTGASSGIGAAAAAALHATGADIFLQVRDMEKGENVCKEILKNSEGKGKCVLVKMNLDNLASVREGAKEFLSQSVGCLNVLICNAGVRNPPFGLTADGYETQFAVNHLSHFLLFNLLLPTLLSSSTPSFNSRVITISSGAHRNSPIYFEDLNQTGEKGYDPRRGYGQSKTANILMANEIEKLFGTKGVHGLSVHPGMIRSGAQRYDDQLQLEKMVKENEWFRILLKTPEQGAATTVWAAVGKVWEGKGGVYLEDCRQGVEGEVVDHAEGGYKSWAFDSEAAEKLWRVSSAMVGIQD